MISCSSFLAVGCRRLGSASRTRAIPAGLAARGGEHVAERRPRAERAVADHELGLVQSSVLEIAHDRGPGLGALAVAVLDRQQLLHAVLADPDHAQQTEPVVLAQPDRDVDAVDEQVRVAMKPQRALPKARVLGLPVRAQPADRRRRQAGRVLAEQLLQRRAEVARREAGANRAPATGR
jgi:hypothetical protein